MVVMSCAVGSKASTIEAGCNASWLPPPPLVAVVLCGWFSIIAILVDRGR